MDKKDLNLFSIVPDGFFKPLTSKYKTVYVDCIRIIFNAYKTELSFGVDKDVILNELEMYFENQFSEEMIFDEDEEEIARDAKTKANAILRRLKANGWLEEEIDTDYRVKVNLFDYSVTMIESFNKIVENDEVEYQSLVSQIHATLLNEESYTNPYAYIIKRVVENTEELKVGLKKLNTNIKKYIEAITSEKTAEEIVQDFVSYHKNIGSKAYHRIKTSDNISYFRTSIIENLMNILSDKDIFERAVVGYMEIEQVENIIEAEDLLRGKIISVVNTFRNYDDIISEIDNKNAKYITSAVRRAQFLLNSSNNTEGKISQVLSYLADEFNKEDTLNLYDEVSDDLFEVFNIFPQRFVNSDSLYVVPINKETELPEELDSTLVISEEERALRKLQLFEKNKNRFSRKNINDYVGELLKDNEVVLASSLPLETKRDLIKTIFISLYGKDKKSKFKTRKNNEVINVNGFEFTDFVIERCK